MSRSPTGQSGETDEALAAAKFKIDLIALAPQLRAFAHTLSGDHAGADDLAQEALIKAWQHRASFVPGHQSKRRGCSRFCEITSTPVGAGRPTRTLGSGRGRTCCPGRRSDLGGRTVRHGACAQVVAGRATRSTHPGRRGRLCVRGSRPNQQVCVGTIKSRVARGRRALIAMLDGERALSLSVRPKPGGAAGQIIAQLDRFTSAADCPPAQQPDGNLKRASSGTGGSPRALQRRD